MPSLTPWNPVLLTLASSNPHFSCGAAPTSPTAQLEKAKSLCRGNHTSSRSTRPGPQTRMPLSPRWCHPSNLPHIGMAAHERCPFLEAPRSKQNRGCSLSHARVTCTYAFGPNPWLGTHIACYFPEISHNPNFESKVLYHEFRTNFAPVLHAFNTNFAMLLHNSRKRSSLAGAVTPAPSTRRGASSLAPPQHHHKGFAKHADSSSRSHPASQSGPEATDESEPEPGLDRQIHVISMPNCGTGDTGCNGLQFDKLCVSPH